MLFTEQKEKPDITVPCITAVPKKKNSPRPLLVILHGLGKSADDYSYLPRRINQTDYNYLIPSAPYRVLKNNTWGYGWLLTPLEGDDKTGRQLAQRYIMSLIKKYRGLLNCGPETYLMAFSQASFIAACLSVKYPDIFSKTIIQGGWAIPGVLDRIFSGSLEGYEFLLQHGKNDKDVPPAYGRKLAAYLTDHDGHVTFKEYNCGHVYTDAMLKDVDLFLKEKKI
ncbi:MAG TPA: hypothetical protein VKS21_10850 [Spirochaetota bacterium]|nr:hypothetical protein [Spirochaetota bacterium]